MKYKIIVVCLIATFINSGAYAIAFKNNDDRIEKELFLKAENIAIKNRANITKKRFLDPIGNDVLFYKIVKSETPDLINNTNKYKLGLMKLLKDNTIKKDWYSESDIINLLSNLCIDNYIEIIDSVRISVIKGQLKFKILEKVIFQDFNVSNQVARNYKSPTLHKSLEQLKLDVKSGRLIIPKDNYGFMEQLNKLISGETWESELKNDEQISPPLLNPKDCK